MPAIDADRHVDLAHHDRLAVAHVTGIALDQIRTDVAAGGEPGGVVEYPEWKEVYVKSVTSKAGKQFGYQQ